MSHVVRFSFDEEKLPCLRFPPPRSDTVGWLNGEKRRGLYRSRFSRVLYYIHFHVHRVWVIRVSMVHNGSYPFPSSAIEKPVALLCINAPIYLHCTRARFICHRHLYKLIISLRWKTIHIIRGVYNTRIIKYIIYIYICTCECVMYMYTF